jgi:hypothetical protein
MTTAIPDFPFLWVEAINIAAYSQNRLPNKHLLSSTTPFQDCHCNRQTISPLPRFRSKCNIHIQVEEHCYGSKHLTCACLAIIVGYTSSHQLYRVFTFEVTMDV